MGPAALLAAAVVALAAAQPLAQQAGEQAGGQGLLSTTPAEAATQGMVSTTPAQATMQRLVSTPPDQPTTHGMVSTPPANKSEEVPPALVEKVKNVVVGALRAALEWHHNGGGWLVTAKQFNVPGAPSLLITLHRSAASLKPKAQLTSRLAVPTTGEDVASRAADEPSAEASPLTIEPLAAPVVPRGVPIALPLAYAGDGGYNVVVGNEVPHNEAHGSPTDETAREGRKPNKGGEISQRSAQVAKATQTVVALMSKSDGPSGLGLLSRFVKEVNRAVDAVKNLVSRWGGFRAGGRGDGGGRRRDVKGRHVHMSEDRVANLLEAGEHTRGANHT